MKSLALLLTLCLGACNDDAPAVDSGPIVIDVGVVDRPAVDVAPDTAPDVTQPTDAGSDIGADVTDASAPTDASDAGGTFVDGCFVGTPSTMNEILNRCGGAVAFPSRAARGARLLPDGGVQALGM